MILVVTNRAGDTATLDVEPGLTVMEALRDHGVDELMAICGGCCSCATCHIIVDKAHAANLDDISEDENDLLDGSSYRSSTSRLACQITLTDNLAGLHVMIAPED